MLRRILEFFAETLFPARCVVCRSGGEWWCRACRLAVEPLGRNRCSACGSSLHEHACPPGSLDALVVTGFYHDRNLREAIHALKYRGITKLQPQLTAYLKHWRTLRIDPWPWAGEPALAVQALPAAEDRVRERGFDQATLIRDALLEACVPWGSKSEVLQRNGKARSQTELPESLRSANVRGCFTLRSQVPTSAVLLVDDVFTSGATMHEAAQLLKLSGVPRVYGFALALGK